MNTVIVGLGAAGATCAQQLRKLDPESGITIINGEGEPFYLRLDLASLLEGRDPEKLIARPDGYWQEQKIEVINARAVKLNAQSKQIELDNGQVISYDKLMLAVGAEARKLGVPGSDLRGVHRYRTMRDALELYAMRDAVKRAVIIGGGILGMEIAHAASEYDWQTTLLVRESYPGFPLLDREGGEFVERRMRASGIEVMLNAEAAGYEGESGKLAQVVTKVGRPIETDMVVECIGIETRLDFLKEHGIAEGGRIVVDAHLQTKLPDVYSAGDAAEVRFADGRVNRGYTWITAISQARIAAANMVGQGAEWNEGTAINADFFFDQEFMMIGPWDRRHLEGRKIESRVTDESFAAVVANQGVLESALLIGDKSQDKVLRKLIAAGAKRGEFDLLS